MSVRAHRSRHQRRGAVLGTVMAIVVSGMAGIHPQPALAVDDPCLPPDAEGVVQCIFNYTGSAQYWVMPTGVTSATYELDGAQGESESSFLRGGFGANAEVTLPVAPNDWGKTLRLIVGGVGANGVGGYGGGGNGGAGANGQNLGSGGGGGASWLSVEFPEVGFVDFIVAGGGGGVGDSSLDANGGVGGHASSPGLRGQSLGNAGGGGAGGGGNTSTATGGAAGAAGTIVSLSTPCNSAQGEDDAATAGTDGQGGTGGTTTWTLAGGGGGGGVYGGGGGGASWSCDTFPAGGGGGGGGSSYGPDEAVITNLGNTGPGQIVITYTGPVAPPTDTTPPVVTPTIGGTLGDNGWYTSPVTVDFAVSDPESAVTTSCEDTTLSADTIGTAVTCSATSGGGTTQYSATFKIDTTAPSLNPTVTPSTVAVGGTATASAGATDATSGIASQSCETPTTTSVGEKVVQCTAKDNAGNTSQAPASYQVTDPTAPTITPTIGATLGDNGWYTSPVTVDFAVSDPESAVTTTCEDTTLSADTTGTAVACSAASAGGTTSYSATFKIDTTAPSLNPTVTPSTVAVGGTVTAAPHATDATSGMASASCDEPDTVTAGTKSLTCRATDLAGNSGTTNVAYEVTDPTPPQVDVALSGTQGDGGWYTSNVEVDFTVADGESDISTTCTDRTVTAQGAAVTVTCSATSAGGTTPVTVTLKIDKTAPSLAPTISPNPVAIGGTAVADPHATDATSGIASSSCDTPVTSTAGVRSVDCRARDRAGNTATSTVGYTVGYRFLGFAKPPEGTTVKAGSNLPVAFTLGSASGAKLSDAQAGALVGSCLVRVAFTAGIQGSDCASYNPTSDTFTFDLKTPKGASGSQTITVRVYAGSDVVTSAALTVKLKG